jgi:pteridine reductase
MPEQIQQNIVREIALKRPGTPEDIAAAVVFLVRDAPYVTGQILAVDGGRSVGW